MKIMFFSDYAGNNHGCVYFCKMNIFIIVELLSLFLEFSLHLFLGTECFKSSLLDFHFLG